MRPDAPRTWRFDRYRDAFPLGKTPLVMLTLFLLSALMVGLGSREKGQHLTYWAFARIHYEDYAVAKKRFEVAYPGWTVDLKLVDGRTLVNRLTAAFMRGSGAPDACDIDITSINRFFKGNAAELPIEDVEKLGARYGDEGWTKTMVQNRFTPWSYQGRIFGVPLALNPVVLLYRQDLFAKLGYPDLPAVLHTWDDFVQIGRQVSRPREEYPQNPRYAIALQVADIWEYLPMLQQHGGGMYNAQGQVIINRPEAVQTLQAYVEMFNQHNIAWPIRDLPSLWAAIKRDEVLSFLAADWFVGFLRNNVPEHAGKWRAMPLPAWREGGRRASTFGGSTTIIPVQGQKKEMAWAFTRFFFLSPEESVNRALRTRVMPVVHQAYEDPRLIEEEFAYLGGQQLGKLFALLKDDIPPVYFHSSWPETSELLKTAVYQAVRQEDTPRNLLRQLQLDAKKIVERYKRVEAQLYSDE